MRRVGSGAGVRMIQFDPPESGVWKGGEAKGSDFVDLLVAWSSLMRRDWSDDREEAG